MDVKKTPRWLHEKVTVPAGSITRVSPTAFKNLESWDWHLHWLSVTGLATEESTAGDYGYDSPAGGVGRRLTWRIGITGEGDINLVEDMTDCVFGINERLTQLHDVDDVACRFRFPIPFVLAPDTGIVAQVRNDYFETAATTWDYPAIVLNGYQKRPERVGKTPAQLAGTGPQALAYGATHIIESADLLNNGRDPLYLTEMLITPCQIATDSTGEYTSLMLAPQLNRLHWRINPSTGVPWMPRKALIPAGNIAPFNRAIWDFDDQAPRAMRFPEGTALKPKQAVSMEIRNRSTEPQVVDICLFGLLEVS